MQVWDAWKEHHLWTSLLNRAEGNCFPSGLLWMPRRVWCAWTIYHAEVAVCCLRADILLIPSKRRRPLEHTAKAITLQCMTVRARLDVPHACLALAQVLVGPELSERASAEENKGKLQVPVVSLCHASRAARSGCYCGCGVLGLFNTEVAVCGVRADNGQAVAQA